MQIWFYYFLLILVYVLIAGVVARVILSWFPIGGDRVGPIVAIIYQITEPILAPIRRLNLRVGIFDLTPTVALFILIIIERLIQRLPR